MEPLRHIVVTLEVEGIHSWPEAAQFEPDVAFLENDHRHLFKIKMHKAVFHNDRDVEIIVFKRKVLKYLFEKYGAPCFFGRKSCEDLAEEILYEFTCDHVEVLEDGENGASISYLHDVEELLQDKEEDA